MSNDLNIAQQGILVSLSISLWTARKHDREISEEIKRDHAAKAQNSEQVGRYNKVLIDRSESDTYGALEKLRNEAKDHYYKVTLPISMQGAQVLAASGYFDFQQEFAAMQSRFDVLADKFADEYPTIRERARVRLNGMFKEEDYPAAKHIRDRFAFKYSFMPIPDAAALHVPAIGAEAEEEIRRQVSETMRAELAAAARDPWDRVHDVVAKLRDKLAGFNPAASETKDKGIFRDSLVENVRELAGILPRLNLTGDPELTKMAEKLTRDLCDFKPQELREDANARRQTINRADAILATMSGFGAAA